MILFDVYHLPQWNFLRSSIHSVEAEERIVCCVDRSKLVSIIRKELNGGTFIHFGSYRNNFGFLSMVFLIIIPRTLWLIYILRKLKVTYVISANYQSNLAARFWGIPNIVFNDDPRKGVIQIARFAANVTYLTKGLKYPGTRELNCLKEWAYLAPKYFSPDRGVLTSMGLSPFGYIMLREVSTETTNYSQQKAGMLITAEVPEGVTVILSLENKKMRAQVPIGWTILEEPVNDIHSLMFFARGFASTGDSMAREAAELGAPSFYSGIRDMGANKVLIDMGLMEQATAEEAIARLCSLKPITDVQAEVNRRQEIRERIAREWDDVNELIQSHLKETKK